MAHAVAVERAATLLRSFAVEDQQAFTALVLDSAAAPTSSALHTALSALVATVLAPALHPTATALEQLCTYIVEALFPALEPGTELAVQDVLIDAIWQTDQDIEHGFLAALPAPAPADLKALNQAASARLEALVKALVANHVLPLQACLERLETRTLVASGVLATELRSFDRKIIQTKTGLFYKQQKFNLLREESEGYSKLMVEIMASMGEPHSPATGRSVDSKQQRVRRAQEVNDSVKSLIGVFDLDSDRALDIILDVFSDYIVTHHEFFLDFLRISPWAPKKSASLETMDVDDQRSSTKSGKARETLLDNSLDGDKGSSLIAQILGFKYKYYQGTGVEETPEKLSLMTSLLIWNGFVKFADLWSHLSPDDTALKALENVWREKQAALVRSVGGNNALANAGALVDDDAPANKPSTSKSAAVTAAAVAAKAAATKRALPNQKLSLLRALLAVGDLKHGLYIIAQFPFLVPAYPDIADLLSRLLGECIRPAYDTISVMRDVPGYALDIKTPRMNYSSTTKGQVPPPRPALFISARAFPKIESSRQYVFFFSEWKDRLPMCASWDETLDVLEVMLPLVGMYISNDFSLFTRLCRIVCKVLGNSPSPQVEARWIDLVRLYLLPSLSLLKDHAPAALEIWTVLQLIPIERRYAMYGEWKDSAYRRSPILTLRKAETERDVKAILRRLSTENVKQLGKALAKVAHTNPTITFAIALNQVQSYDNLIGPVVEASRYFTEFGYDVMTYSLLDALCSGKSKTKDDGTSVAIWLQGLAMFAGQLYSRWSRMEGSIWIVFQYLVNQLVAGNYKDLVILRELISRMTGFEPFADLADAQVNSLAGGKLLRSEVFYQTEISHASNRQNLNALASSRNRLIAAVRRSGLAMPLLVNIAVQRQACVSDTEPHLKSLGGLFDGVHAVLFQYMEFLAASLEPDELASTVPAVHELMGTYGLEPAVAFDIARPKLRRALRIHDEAEAKQMAARRAAGMAKLAQEKLAATKAAESPAIPTSVAVEDVPMTEVVPIVDAPAMVVAAEVAVAKPPPVLWHPGLLDVIEKVGVLLPEHVQSLMGSAFFVTFWQLNLYDVHIPKDRYEAEIARLITLQRETSASSAIDSNEKDKFITNLIDLAGKLTEEFRVHSSARASIWRRLGREKSSWFPVVKTPSQRRELVKQIVQYCVHPRAKLSLPDAVYAAHFVRKMHMLNTDGFHTILFYDQLLSEQIGPILYSCTENEARNYSRFLFEMLTDVNRWYKDAKAYKDECTGARYHGFLQKYPKTPTVAVEADFYSHAQYCTLVDLWQIRLLEAFSSSFESGEYTSIKNSVLVLTKIASLYPLQLATCSQLETSVSGLILIEKREDLKILATGYKAVLQKRKRQFIDPSKPSMIESSSKNVSTPVSPVARRPVGLPIRPGNTSNGGSSMDVDRKPTSSAIPIVRPPTASETLSRREAGQSSSQSQSSNSLPTRPGQSSHAGASASSSSSNPLPSRPKDRGAMEPPSSSGGRKPDLLPSNGLRQALSSDSSSDRKPVNSSSSSRDSERPSDRGRGGEATSSRDVRDARDARDLRDARDSRDKRDSNGGTRERERDRRDGGREAGRRESGHGGDFARDGPKERDSRDALKERESNGSREEDKDRSGRGERDRSSTTRQSTDRTTADNAAPSSRSSDRSKAEEHRKEPSSSASRREESDSRESARESSRGDRETAKERLERKERERDGRESRRDERSGGRSSGDKRERRDEKSSRREESKDGAGNASRDHSPKRSSSSRTAESSRSTAVVPPSAPKASTTVAPAVTPVVPTGPRGSTSTSSDRARSLSARLVPPAPIVAPAAATAKPVVVTPSAGTSSGPTSAEPSARPISIKGMGSGLFAKSMSDAQSSSERRPALASQSASFGTDSPGGSARRDNGRGEERSTSSREERRDDSSRDGGGSREKRTLADRLADPTEGDEDSRKRSRPSPTHPSSGRGDREARDESDSRGRYSGRKGAGRR